MLLDHNVNSTEPRQNLRKQYENEEKDRDQPTWDNLVKLRYMVQFLHEQMF